MVADLRLVTMEGVVLAGVVQMANEGVSRSYWGYWWQRCDDKEGDDAHVLMFTTISRTRKGAVLANNQT